MEIMMIVLGVLLLLAELLVLAGLVWAFLRITKAQSSLILLKSRFLTILPTLRYPLKDLNQTFGVVKLVMSQAKHVLPWYVRWGFEGIRWAAKISRPVG